MKKHLSLLVVCLLLITVVPMTSYAAPSKAEISFVTLKNDKLGYQLKHPSNWVVTSVDGSPQSTVVFQAENGESFSIECNSNSPEEMTIEDVLEFSDVMVQGMTDAAKKDGLEIAITTEPSLYETENETFVIISGGMYSDKNAFFFDILLLPSKTTLYSLAFYYLTQEFSDQIKVIADSFTLI